MGKGKTNFTNESIRLMTCELGKRRTIYYDKKVPKLACMVSASGIKTFSLHTFDRLRKKPLQKTIGRYPEVTINQAREIAVKMLGQLADGRDIQEASKVIRAEPTVDELFEEWLKGAKDNLRTWHNLEQIYQLHIRPFFGKHRIGGIKESQVKVWHSELLKTNRQRKKNNNDGTLSKATANRCLMLLRSVLNRAGNKYKNPCLEVEKFRETPRERFLKPDEREGFLAALADPRTEPTLRDMVILLLATGARKSNLLSMMWAEIDFTSAIWTIPATKSKTGKSIRVALVAIALETLKRRKTNASTEFVFPGRGKTGHIVEPKRAWKGLVNRAGLNDFRLHDLRRTCGSYQAALGANQALIGKSLGHSSLAATAVYTHFDLDPIRESMEKSASAIFGKNNGK